MDFLMGLIVTITWGSKAKEERARFKKKLKGEINEECIQYP